MVDVKNIIKSRASLKNEVTISTYATREEVDFAKEYLTNNTMNT